MMCIHTHLKVYPIRQIVLNYYFNADLIRRQAKYNVHQYYKSIDIIRMFNKRDVDKHVM